MFGARRLLNLRKLSLSHQEELRSDVSKAVEVSNEAEVAIRGHMMVVESRHKSLSFIYSSRRLSKAVVDGALPGTLGSETSVTHWL